MRLSIPAVRLLPLVCVLAACSSSSSPAAVEGPGCTALAICCNQFPSQASAEADNCNSTQDGWVTGAATADQDCAAAQAQYEKDHLCGADVEVDGGADDAS